MLCRVYCFSGEQNSLRGKNLSGVISVDIAFRKTGLVILNQAGEIESHKTLIVKDKIKYVEGMKVLYDLFNQEFQNINTGNYILVVEDVASYVHIKAALSIHAARSAVVIAWMNSDGDKNRVFMATPNQVKKFYTGKANAGKDAVLAGLKIKYPQYDYTSLTEDEIDALALALYYRENDVS